MKQSNTDIVLGAFLEYAREYCMISRNEFCEMTGLSYNRLWDIEKGHRIISIKKLKEYIQKLGLTEEVFWDLALKCLQKRKRAAMKAAKEGIGKVMGKRRELKMAC